MSHVSPFQRQSSSCPSTESSAQSADDIHAIYTLIRQHGRMAPAAFSRLVRRFRAGVTDDIDAERLLANYGVLISAMVKLRSPKGVPGVTYRERAFPAAIAACFEVLGDPAVPARFLALRKAINERVTRALEHELSLGRPFTVPAASAWRAAQLQRTADAVFVGATQGLTRDEIYAVLGERIRLQNVHVVLLSNYPLELDTSPPARHEGTNGVAARATERLARALATLPPLVARQIVDRYGLFGSSVIPVADTAAALGIHPGTYRRSLRRAEASLRAALAAQGDATLGVAMVEMPDTLRRKPPPSLAGDPEHGEEGAAAYRRELEAGRPRSARRLALAIVRCAEYKGWGRAETEAAVRRLVAFRTGQGAAARHPLALQILDQIRVIQTPKKRSCQRKDR